MSVYPLCLCVYLYGSVGTLHEVTPTHNPIVVPVREMKSISPFRRVPSPFNLTQSFLLICKTSTFSFAFS